MMLVWIRYKSNLALVNHIWVQGLDIVGTIEHGNYPQTLYWGEHAEEIFTELSLLVKRGDKWICIDTLAKAIAIHIQRAVWSETKVCADCHNHYTNGGGCETDPDAKICSTFDLMEVE